MIREISGSGSGSARLLRENLQDLNYTATMFWAMNEFPRMPTNPGDASAVYRRLRVLPVATIDEREIDITLKDLWKRDAVARQALVAEMVKACMANPSPPADTPSVAETRKKMRDESVGEVALWLEKALVPAPDAVVAAPDIWDRAVKEFGIATKNCPGGLRRG